MIKNTNSQFSEQLERIRHKLEIARKSDPRFLVFGADWHRYRLAPPVAEEALKALEEKHQIELPADFRAFVTNIGDGLNDPKWPDHGGAGPYYGIIDVKTMLSHTDATAAPMFAPDIADQAWAEIQQKVDDGEIRVGEVIRGSALLASQGCSYCSLLILQGPDKGRIVNFDDEGTKPRFAFEKNFLDWYERWLDEVIAGYLSKSAASWFGMTMGGDDNALLELFDRADDTNIRKDALTGFFKLVSLSTSSISRLSEIASSQEGQIRELAVRILLKFKPETARPFLVELLKDVETDLSLLCLFIPKSADYLVPEIEAELIYRLKNCNDHDVFFRIVALLAESGVDIGLALVPFFSHANSDFRRTIIWALGKLEYRHRFVPTFVAALRDQSAEVVLQALQSTRRLYHSALIAEFSGIRRRCESEPGWDRDGYVLTNLKIRESETARAPHRWFQFRNNGQ